MDKSSDQDEIGQVTQQPSSPKNQHLSGVRKHDKESQLRTANMTCSDPQDEMISRLSSSMVDAVQSYLTAELSMNLDEYKLLTDVNKASTRHYSELSERAKRALAANIELAKKCETFLSPQNRLFLEIDELDTKVTALENTAYAIDAYSKRLEAKFKKLDEKE